MNGNITTQKARVHERINEIMKKKVQVRKLERLETTSIGMVG
jgi:hypothetical protein